MLSKLSSEFKILNKKVKIVFAVLCFCLLAFIGTIATIAIRYDLSPYFTAKLIGRQVVLSAASVAVSFYDPWATNENVFGPKTSEKEINIAQYVRFESLPTEAYLGKILQIKVIKNEKIIQNKFNFGYQTHKDPKLAALRQEYKLDRIVAPAKTEFEAIILLRNWTRSQFRRSDYQPSMRNFDALQILRDNVRNRNNDPHKYGLEFRPCHFYPLFYAQVLLSMGYQPRLVRISPIEDKGYNGHGMTEVWSNQFRKWIAMDPDLNIHYEKDGVPLNLLEIHNERYVTGPSKIRIIQGIHTAGDFDPSKQVDITDMMQYHSYIQILDMRNDWLTNHYFRGHPKRSDKASLFWVDEKMPPVFNFSGKTSNMNDFYWTLNQTEIWARKQGNTKNTLSLAFKTFTPNFKHFEIITDRERKVISSGPFFTWELHEGTNKLFVRSVNQFEVPGISSWVEIERRS